MGSIRKRKNRYEAEIRRRGLHFLTKTFNYKTDETVWVRAIEARIDAGDLNVLAPKLVTINEKVWN